MVDSQQKHKNMNIVFDMGNVILDYDPSRIVSRAFQNPVDQELFLKEIFQSESWRLLDQGMLTFEEHNQQLAARFPQSADKIDWILQNWHKDQPYIPGICDLIERLDTAKFDLYLLSNANSRYYTFESYMEIFKRFKGITFSSDLKLIKPQQEIFEKFCEIHQLIPADCLFIDDQLDNVRAAQQADWQAYHFVGVDELENFLSNVLKLSF